MSEAVAVNPKIDRTQLADDTSVSFVPMAAVGAADGSIDASTVRPYAEVKKGYTHFRENDVLFAKVTPCMENGKMAVARKLMNGMGFGSTEFHVLRPREGVDPHYVYHFVSSQTFRKEAARHMTGAVGLRRVPSAFLESAEIPLPPLDVQRVIVAELEKQFSRLDEAVANLRRVIANLKRYKDSVLKAAVEGRLVETEANLARREGRTYETGEQLLQRMQGDKKVGWNGRGSFKLPVAPETAELSEVPEGWTWASIDQLAAPGSRSITDGPFGSNLKSAHYVEDGPRVIRLQNIKDGEFEDAYAHITQEHFESLRKHEVFAGDLVIASLGENPPRACIIPAGVGPAIVKADCIRFKPHPALPLGYLNAALNCQPTRMRVKDVLHGIGRPRLSLGEIRAIALPIPPAAEQVRIVAEVDRHMSIIREVEAEVDANLRRAQALRQSTLANVFTNS
ncbi:MAG: restriction endonuclease subunit S [Burkholderiales bacterium]|nr:restriction endonuclease subunit S [Burkholderiales bacterium]